MILKVSKTNDDTIVSANSKVNGKLEECNVVIAGNLAYIIKHDITWEA